MTFGHSNTTTTTHHGARDGALAGGIAGHEGHHGHTGRDAVVGGVGGHLAENHHERHAAHVNNATHNGHGHSAKTVTTTTTIPKPSVTDKIAGQAEVLVGKATHNPNQVAVGEIRKTEGKAATQGLSGNAAAGHPVGGVGTGAGRY